MRLLTIKQVQKAAETSDIAALKCSLRHWREIKALGWDELNKKVKEDRYGYDNEMCACCQRFYGCISCPLAGDQWFSTDYSCCQGLYGEFLETCDEGKRAFSRAAQNIINLIQSKIDEISF